MTSSDDAHPSLSATHYCKDCGALWRQCDDFSWNLRQLTCCKQCDNTPVGGQLIALTELVAEQQERLKASDRTKKIDAIRRLYLKDLDATSDIELATEVIGKEIAVARERGRLEGLDEAIRICGEWYASEAPKARLGNPMYARGMDIASSIEDEIRALKDAPA